MASCRQSKVPEPRNLSRYLLGAANLRAQHEDAEGLLSTLPP